MNSAAPKTEGQTAGNKPAVNEPRRRSSVVQGAILAGGAVALVEACLFPGRESFLFLGGAVVVLGLLLLVQAPASKTRLFSVRLRPEWALLATTLWLCVVLSELGLRYFVPLSVAEMESMRVWGTTLGYQFDPMLGWSPVPNTRQTVNCGRTVSVFHNSKGLRDPEPLFDSRPGVLFLGDSFTWGYNVEAAERFTELLRARHPEWQVYNFGVTGYSTDQEYLLLQKQFEAYHPRLVFLVFCTENDENDNGSNISQEAYFKPYFTAEAKGLKLHGTPVPRSEYVFCYQHPILARAYLVRLAVRAWGNLHRGPPASAPNPTTTILEALRDYCWSHGAAFCVGFTCPAPKLQEFLERSNVPHLDLSTDLRISEIDIHWTPDGHAYVANKIEAFLLSTPGLNPTNGHRLVGHSSRRWTPILLRHTEARACQQRWKWADQPAQPIKH